MQTATNDDSSPAAPPAAKKQKIGNTNSANASEFDNDDVEEEMRQLDLDSLDLSTTGRIEIPEWGTADKDWSCLGLQKKLELYDLLVKMIAKKPEGQSIRNFIGATACMSVNTYHDWNREDKAEAIRAAIKEVPGRGFQSRIFGFDWRQYRPQNSVSDREEVTITEEAEEKMLEEEAKDNARLTLAALKDHVPSNVTVIDGTSGERIFLSDEQTTELFTCVLVDKYKNEVRNCNKYKGVLSYNCDEFRQYVSSRVAMAFIWDPPYRTINGGHTVVNCTMSKSQSRIRFNNAYGVEYKYTNEMINAMYLRGFYWANQLLHEDGVFLVKCMHENDGVAQQQAVIEMGQLYDFCLKGSYTLKSRTTTKDSSKCNDSFLLVMKRNTNLKSLKDLYPLAEAAEYKEKMTRYINNSAAAAYLEATTKSLKDGKGWLHACLKLEKGLSEEQKRKAFKDIREEVIHSSESFHSMDSKIRKEMNQINNSNNEWCWEELQSLALTSHRMFLDLKNMAGLHFEQHLLQRNVCIEDIDSLETKKKLEGELIGKRLGLVNNKSHVSLSRNIQILRNEKNEEERRQKETERKAEEEKEKRKKNKQKKQQQKCMRNFLVPVNNDA